MSAMRTILCSFRIPKTNYGPFAINWRTTLRSCVCAFTETKRTWGRARPASVFWDWWSNLIRCVFSSGSSSDLAGDCEDCGGCSNRNGLAQNDCDCRWTHGDDTRCTPTRKVSETSSGAARGLSAGQTASLVAQTMRMAATENAF